MVNSNIDEYIKSALFEFKKKYTFDELIEIANSAEKTSDDITVQGIPYLEHIYVLIDDKDKNNLRIVATLWSMSEEHKRSFKERIFWFIEKPDAQADLIVSKP